MLITSGLSILLQGVISLQDARSCDIFWYNAKTLAKNSIMDNRLSRYDRSFAECDLASYKKAKTAKSQKQDGRTEEETAKPSFPWDSIAFSRNPRYFGTSSRNVFFSSA